MAKVSGPLFSLEARGKIADAVVYFPWKGLHVVRQWLVPANPQSEDQGDMRLICGALGRSTSVIGTANAFAAEIREYMDAGLTWPSAIAKYMIDQVINDGAAWDTLYAEYAGHSAKAGFDSEAAALNIQPFDVAYKGATNAAPAGMILYLAAKFSTNWELLGTKGFQRAPYTTALASWTITEVQSMVAEF